MQNFNFLILFFLYISSPLFLHAEFNTELVDAPHQFSNMGDHSSLVDGNGKMHIAYGEDRLYYATNTSGSWVITVVDAASATGENTSLALDSNGKVHISYYEEVDMSNANLKYATNVSGKWIKTTLDAVGTVHVVTYSSTAIAIDGNGKVHISYLDYDDGAINYVTNILGSWAITPIDIIGFASNCSIAIDSGNKVHISYYDLENTDLRYATNKDASWHNEGVDITDDVVGAYNQKDFPDACIGWS